MIESRRMRIAGGRDGASRCGASGLDTLAIETLLRLAETGWPSWGGVTSVTATVCGIGEVLMRVGTLTGCGPTNSTWPPVVGLSFLMTLALLSAGATEIPRVTVGVMEAVSRLRSLVGSKLTTDVRRWTRIDRGVVTGVELLLACCENANAAAATEPRRGVGIGDAVVVNLGSVVVVDVDSVCCNCNWGRSLFPIKTDVGAVPDVAGSNDDDWFWDWVADDDDGIVDDCDGMVGNVG